jgi:maltose alpha-D-glucosyltransferase/alpha-amylase
VCRDLVAAYVAGVTDTRLLPADPAGCDKLLHLLQLERALEEIDYDLEVRPAWAAIPLAAVLRLLDRAS